MEQKNTTWKNITSDFNSTSSKLVHRTTESLKKFYDNKKKVVCKQKSEERKQTILTGGGPLHFNNKYEPQDIVLSLMDPLMVLGNENNFDSDSLPVNIVQKKNSNISNDLVFELSWQVCYVYL